MAQLTGTSILSYNDIYSSDTTIPGGNYLGQLQPGANGKWFRYVLTGASALVTGNLIQSSAEDTTYENMAVLASAISTSGVQTVNITNGTATITAQQFSGGSVSVYTTPDLGSEYTILDVKGVLTTGGALTVTLDRPIQTAWTTSTKVNMKRSPWSGVIQSPASTQTGIAVGVAQYAIPAASYGWIQTGGVAAVLSDGSTFAVGSGVGTPSGTAGCVTVFAAGTTHMLVGHVQQAAAAGHCISALLQID